MRRCNPLATDCNIIPPKKPRIVAPRPPRVTTLPAISAENATLSGVTGVDTTVSAKAPTLTRAGRAVEPNPTMTAGGLSVHCSPGVEVSDFHAANRR